ncbi:MAG TPA: flagellar M-ring protein FliF [Candidatus Avoscillospira avistercoris]|uniref:Flagellar M-ring protein FliF n=1 Tax=Candidatus Avoscillospira avistercoris TaxID=2840707 RepID=A0A9D1F8Y3_9FIRM|nr:flagellar M-ring protein FliF [Candidatus Avoscillospira avistercoris]
MQEKVKGFLNKGKQLWTGAKKRTKILAAAVLVVAAGAIVAVVVASQNQPYATLFTELSQTDMTAITSYLTENGVSDFRIVEDDTIMVPADQEVQLKAQLVSQGYVNSGYAYNYSTYLDNVSALTTESERQQLALYELNDSTSAVIRSMEGVKDATVRFTPGEDNTYVLDSGNVVEASAYVKVTMKDGVPLSETMANGIRNLVSSAIQGLKVENVTIVDSYGNTYAPDDGLGDLEDSAALKLRLEEQVNNTLEKKIMSVLEPVYGAENVSVSVNSIVDVDKVYTDSTNYSTEDWAADGSTNGEGIIGQKIYDNRLEADENGTAGGTVGTDTNADIPTYPENEGEMEPGNGVVSSTGQTNYLVDEENKQVQRVGGTIADVMVSVTINEAVSGGVDVDDLYPHVARAAGITTADQMEKVHILIAPFNTGDNTPVDTDEDTTTDDGLLVDSWILYAALGGLVLFVLILVLVLLLIRRHRRKKAAALAAELEQSGEILQEAAPTPEGADIMEMQTEKSMELRKDVRKFAEENPEIAAQMVRNWLKEGESME